MVSKVSNDTSITPLTMNWEGGMDVFVVEDDTNHDQVTVIIMSNSAIAVLLYCRTWTKRKHDTTQRT